MSKNLLCQLFMTVANLLGVPLPMAVRLDCCQIFLQLPVRLLPLAAGLVMTGSVSPALATSDGGVAAAAPQASSPVIRTTIRLSQVPDILQLDDSGDGVAALQTRLAELGFYNGPISGIFGPQTEAAVIRFQEAKGLTPDGIAGPITRTALQNAQSPGSTAVANDGLLQQGDTGEQVVALQQRLRTLGFYNGAVSGIFGPQTEMAVVAFQRSQGLVTDGIVGQNTAAALLNPAPAATTTDPAPTTPEATPPPIIAPVTPAPTAPATTPAPTTPIPQTELPPPQVMPSPSFPAPTGSAEVGATFTGYAPLPDTEGKFSVIELQWMLRQRGFYRGPIDGVLGRETQRAISDAQRAYGLSESDLE